MTKKAFITGVAGQDGSYLAEFLLHKGYEVHGLVRRAGAADLSRIARLCGDGEIIGKRFFLHYGDLDDSSGLFEIIRETQPDELYNLGGQSHVGMSFEIPEYTGDVSGLAVTRLLEAVRKTAPHCRFYQASSSELFGSTPPPQSETSPFHPKSPYAVSKLYAHWATVNFREAFGLHASNGILFNHESPRRGADFVTRKITRAVARILAGRQQKLVMGNIEGRKDWGFAPDYVECFRLITQQDAPDDYVIGSGRDHSVKDFLELAFGYVGLDWSKYVETDAKFFRPSEANIVRADIAKAKQRLNWSPRVSFEELAWVMMDHELAAEGCEAPGKDMRCLREKNFDWLSDGCGG
jgi:GDPmannose 4,6-dehydratase